MQGPRLTKELIRWNGNFAMRDPCDDSESRLYSALAKFTLNRLKIIPRLEHISVGLEV